ncbi:ABC transporter substrate-binding protein [Microlunatus speluncae]|uniref:ABC transporter substrate-binding protein n=1 Tax=Microlunatus speluncae TaxID=2594267 RepID=UPI001375BB9A|nr:ABC transporter substrate-binding protein [Microlunatus speluncae]
MITRKRFLALAGITTGSAGLAGCGFFSIGPDQGGGEESTGPKGKEAPMLAEQVSAGTLPAVDQRLPKAPRVIEPLERVGQYGGTLQTVLESTDASWLWMTVVHDHLITWDPLYTKIIPNIAESFEVEQDGRVYVFRLREGMRWSDGEPLTSGDLTWWHENVLLNEKITPVVPRTLTSNGKPVQVSANGDWEVTFTFDAPNSLFLEQIAIHGPPFRLLPRHYLEKFHKDFNAELKDDWAEDFLAKIDELENIELPVLSAWVPKNPHGDGGRQVWERNPYYWKTDPDGSQLPYIDQVVFTFFSDEGPLLLAAANGDVDIYQRQEVTIPKNRPVLSEGMEQGGYSLIKVREPNHNTIGVCLNLNVKDAGKRKMFQNKDFRIGLSQAINRQQIIDLVYQRQGRPWQTAPRPEVPFYTSEDFGTQYTEFDLDVAREHFAKAGYSELNADKRLLGEGGKPIVISVLCQSRYPDLIDAMEFVKRTWNEVGIELRIDTASPELVSTRMEANDYDCTLDKGELGYLDLIADPRWLFATGGSSYAPLWSAWYEGGDPNEAPPEAMQRQMTIYREQVVSTSDQAAQYAAIKEIIEIARDEFWTMGISLPGDPFCIKTNRIHNVPGDDQMWMSFKCPYPAVTNMTTYYLDS